MEYCRTLQKNVFPPSGVKDTIDFLSELTLNRTVYPFRNGLQMARGLGHRSRNSRRWVLPGYTSWLIPSSPSALSGGHTFLPVLLPVPRPTESAFVLSSSNCHRIIHSPRGHTVPSLFDVTVCAPTYFSRP